MLIVGLLSLNSLAMADRIPAYVFPDEESDVITHLRISEDDLEQYSRVLDTTLEGTWYWTTHKDKFTGYVSKDDIDGKRSLKQGTVIRTNPTYSSWPLTKYEEDDKVRVRSKLSVGRVSFTKEIPVYFRFDKPETVQAEPIAQQPISPATIPERTSTDLPVDEPMLAGMETATPDAGLPEVETPIEPSMDEAQPTALSDEPLTENGMDESSEIETSEEPVAEMPNAMEETPAPITPAPTEDTYVDPLLEEAPRISPQDLVNLAAPPTDLFQEFEGFLRIVSQEDPMSGVFRYQLNTRSGKRIVYVATRHMIDESFLEYLNAWINIRGTLEETAQEKALYIEAHNIWVAPGN